MWGRVFVTVCVASSTFLSCGKDSSADESSAPARDSIAPAITINSPSNNQQYAPGETIYIQATATDATSVTEMHIHTTDETKGKLLRDVHAYPVAKTGTVVDSFPAVSGIHYKIRIIAYDPAQNIGFEDVFVQCN